MRTRIALIFFFGLLACCESVAQETFTIDQLRFKSIFATKANEPDSVYCILGTGEFRAMRTKDSDSVVSSWIGSHPHAQVLKVSEMKPLRRNGTGAYIFIWVKDGKENLNIFLIREGVFQAGVMHDAIDFFHSMTEIGTPSSEEHPHLHRFVSDDQYEVFLNEANEAEKRAKADKNGIWSDEYKAEREAEGIE